MTILTTNEKEMLLLILDELDNKEIALKLNKPAQTTAHTRQDLYCKLGTTNPVGLIKNALRENLLTLQDIKVSKVNYNVRPVPKHRSGEPRKSKPALHRIPIDYMKDDNTEFPIEATVNKLKKAGGFF